MSLKQIFQSKESDSKSLDFILQALNKSNLEGFDYIEFIQAVERLKAMPMEELLAYKSAFSTVNTVGLSKEKLLDSAEHYLDVLEKESKVFRQTVEERRLVRIERQKRRIKALEDEIANLESRIVQMKEKIEDYRKEQDEIKVHLDTESEKISLTEKSFNETMKIVQSRIKVDIDIINKNI